MFQTSQPALVATTGGEGKAAVMDKLHDHSFHVFFKLVIRMIQTYADHSHHVFVRLLLTKSLKLLFDSVASPASCSYSCQSSLLVWLQFHKLLSVLQIRYRPFFLPQNSPQCFWSSTVDHPCRNPACSTGSSWSINWFYACMEKPLEDL